MGTGYTNKDIIDRSTSKSRVVDHDLDIERSESGQIDLEAVKQL
jgi:hypothetical protein